MEEPLLNDASERENPRAFSLRLVVLFVTCNAVAMGLVWHWPGLLQFAAFLGFAAVLRTWSLMRAGGISAEPRWKSLILSLLGSLGVMGVVGSTSAAAFLSVCLPLAATQTSISDEPPVPVLYYGAWVLGGTTAAAVAALSLDRLWLAPLSVWMRSGALPAAKQRARKYFAIAVPALAAIVIGGLSGLLPAAFFFEGTAWWTVLACVGKFVVCFATLAGGGWVGFRAGQRLIGPVAAFLGWLIGMLVCYTTFLALDRILTQDSGLASRLDSADVGVATVVLGIGAAAMTWLTVQWAHEPD